MDARVHPTDRILARGHVRAVRRVEGEVMAARQEVRAHGAQEQHAVLAKLDKQFRVPTRHT